MKALFDKIVWRIFNRKPDVVIGGKESPYLLRWFVIPRNPFLNIYLHEFHRPDDDRALHDHPWMWASYVIDGQYVEHTIKSGLPVQRLRKPGSWAFRLPKTAHRIELEKGLVSDDGRQLYFRCWTLFITGPRIRNWGFNCPQGWVPWQLFTDPKDSGATGKGCDQ